MTAIIILAVAAYLAADCMWEDCHSNITIPEGPCHNVGEV